MNIYKILSSEKFKTLHLFLENPVVLKYFLRILFLLLGSNYITEAQIVVSDTADCAPFTDVQFNSSAGTGNWDFGDGTSAINVDNAKKTFSNPGTYIVSFYQGGVVVDTQKIVVFGNPNPSFTLTGDSSGCIPFNVPFVDQSTGDGTSNIVDWQWTFGDGGSSIAQNPNYTYSLLGDFTVSLIVTDNNGCDSSHTVSQLISTSNAPTASFTSSILTSCSAPLVVSVSNNSLNGSGNTNNLTYEWDFGGGITSTLKDPSNVTYTTAGPVNISLKVTESGGCSDSIISTGNIGKPTASFVVQDTICINAPYKFINNSLGGTSWVWSFSDGSSSGSKEPSKTFNTSGIHSATLTMTQNGCSHDTTISFFVQEIIPNFIINPTYLCEKPWCFEAIQQTTGGADTFTWDFGDGLPGGSGDTVSHCYILDTNIYTVYNPIYHNVTLIASSKWGCESQQILVDTIYPISAFFSPDTAQGCAPLTVQFSDSTRSRENIVSWEWDFGDGTTSISQNPTHTFSDTGHFTVVLISENSFGCRDTSYPVMIQVGEQIDLDFTIAPSTVCLGDSVTFTDISGSTEIDYWHFGTDGGRSGSCPDQNSQIWAFSNETGLHDVTFSANINGCISDTTIADAVTVKGPSSKFFFNGNCDTPFSYSFDASLSNVESFTWDFGDGTILNSIDLNDTLVNHTYAASGDYTVYLISQNATSGCANDTDSLVVNVREIYAEISGDSVLCSGVAYLFSSANSIDNNNSCNDGFRWDLGDGTQPTITAGNTHSYQFTDTGVYEIRMITKDINLCYDTAYREVRVTRIDAGFSVTPSKGCLPLVVNFTDTSYSDTLFTKWEWDFGNGITSNLQNPTTTYTSKSITQYQVTLTATDSLGCVDTETAYVNPIIPDTNFVVNDRTLCVKDSALFTLNAGAKIASATWNFGDGETSTTLNPWHTFNTAGDFTINVSIIDTNGCTGTKTRSLYIEVDDYPEALFMTNVDSNSVNCHPTQIKFTDTSIVNNFGSRVWDLGVPNPILPNVTADWQYTEPGLYSASLIERTANGCADTLTRVFEIVGPVADFNLDKNNICVGEEITFTMKDTANVSTFQWVLGQTNINLVDPYTHTFTELPIGGKTYVELVVWSEDSVCSFDIRYPINFYEVEARFEFVDSTICENSQAQFINNTVGASVYSWDFGNGSTSTNENPSGQTYSSIGKYNISLAIQDNANGCIDTVVKELEVLPPPVVTATATKMCFGDTALLEASGANTYLWNNTNIIGDSIANPTSAFPSQTTTFTVTGTDTNNCSNTATAEVIVLMEPTGKFIDTACYIIGDSIAIGKDYGPSFTYDWTIGETDYLTCEKCASQVIQIKEEQQSPISFIVEYTDTSGCFSTQDEYEICILNKYTVDVPSAFTPNGAGENDIIYVKGHGIEELFYFRIYNRWGEIVFETNDINTGWDGTYKGGEPQNMETYIYQAKVRFFNGESKEKGGSITLIR